MGILDNRVAVITGSSRGLGLAMAQLYAVEGAAVVLTSRTSSAVEGAVAALRQSGAKVSGIVCDVGDLRQVEALRDHALQTFGQIDIWVNNAALAGPYGPTADIAPEMFERVLRANIDGTYYGSIIAMRYFLPRRSGKLINLLGRGDDGRPAPYQNSYAPTKAWTRSFTLALAKEYRNSGVGVFAFNPGLVETDMMGQIEAIQGYETRLNPLRTVMRLWGNPPEVPARKALWLASSATDGKTGLNVQVLSFPQLMSGALREGARRLTGQRPARRYDFSVTSLPPSTGTR
jgi:NAD(P)-dependent dehydrogenase (short-subunit alcohol dehydrogenase family)